jgi:hypothetical protein
LIYITYFSFFCFNGRIKKEQLETLLDYNIEPMELPKQLGTTKGIVETPWVKIEFKKAGGYCITTFGEFLEVKRKGKAPAVSQAATDRKCKKDMNKSKKIQMMVMKTKKDDIDLQEYKDYLSSKSLKSLPIKTARVGRSSTAEEENKSKKKQVPT